MEELKFTTLSGGALYLNGEKLMDIKSGVETSGRSRMDQKSSIDGDEMGTYSDERVSVFKVRSNGADGAGNEAIKFERAMPFMRLPDEVEFTGTLEVTPEFWKLFGSSTEI